MTEKAEKARTEQAAQEAPEPARVTVVYRGPADSLRLADGTVLGRHEPGECTAEAAAHAVAAGHPLDQA